MIVEGTFSISGGAEKTMTIRAESLKVDNVEYKLEPAVLRFAD